MTPRRVLLVLNQNKPEAVAAEAVVREAIASSGTLVGVAGVDGVTPELAREAELVVALGGDGTLLAIARVLADAPRPLLGVNFGRVGFLSEFDLETFLERAPGLLDRDAPLRLSERPMIDAEVVSGDGRVRHTGHALNDAVVTAGPPFRMIEVEISLGGERGPTTRGDGVIVATPFGSTAYNVSAGGPIVVPDIEALTVTPIAAHSLSFRPIVAPKSARIGLRLRRVNSTEVGGTSLVLDGQQQFRLEEGDEVRLVLGTRTTPLVRNPQWSYWRTLMDKLHWAAPPSNTPGGR